MRSDTNPGCCIVPPSLPLNRHTPLLLHCCRSSSGRRCWHKWMRCLTSAWASSRRRGSRRRRGRRRRGRKSEGNGRLPAHPGDRTASCKTLLVHAAQYVFTGVQCKGEELATGCSAGAGAAVRGARRAVLVLLRRCAKWLRHQARRARRRQACSMPSEQYSDTVMSGRNGSRSPSSSGSTQLVASSTATRPHRYSRS